MESTPKTEPVLIFLVGFDEGFARSIARYLGTDRSHALIGNAPDLSAAGTLLPLARPDLVLIDWATPEGVGRDAISALRAGRPALRIACVADEIEAYSAAATQAGADGVISKGGFAAELEALLLRLFPERFGTTGGRNE